jgi:hypothetical protein
MSFCGSQLYGQDDGRFQRLLFAPVSEPQRRLELSFEDPVFSDNILNT